MRYFRKTFSSPVDNIIPFAELKHLLMPSDEELYRLAVKEIRGKDEETMKHILIDLSRFQLDFTYGLSEILPITPPGIYYSKTGEAVLLDDVEANHNLGINRYDHSSRMVFISEKYPGYEGEGYAHLFGSPLEDIKKGSGYLKLVHEHTPQGEDMLDVPRHMVALFRASLTREVIVPYWVKDAMELGLKIALSECSFLSQIDYMRSEGDRFAKKYNIADEASIEALEVTLNRASRGLADYCRKAILGFGVDIYGDFKGRVVFNTEKFGWNGTVSVYDDVRILDWANMTIQRLNGVMEKADKERYQFIVQSFYM